MGALSVLLPIQFVYVIYQFTTFLRYDNSNHSVKLAKRLKMKSVEGSHER